MTSRIDLAAIVLAAGRSRRAGVFKPAVEIGGRPLLRHAVDGLLPFCRPVVVVTGHERTRTEALVAGLDDVVTVFNPRYEEDMFLSVQAGARALPADGTGFCVLPVDCPFVEADVMRALVDAFAAAGSTCAVIPEHEGRGGHPVLLPMTARAAILAAPAGATLRTIVTGLAPVRVPVASASVLADLDTPADLEAARERHGPDRTI